MTRSELVELIAQRRPEIPRQRLEAIVHAMFDQLSAALVRGERIELRGFGTFGVKVRPAHQARNPRTGDRVEVPARKDVTFAAGKELKERLNDGVSPAAELQQLPTATPAREPDTAPAATGTHP